jgi:hypothetical protein
MSGTSEKTRGGLINGAGTTPLLLRSGCAVSRAQTIAPFVDTSPTLNPVAKYGGAAESTGELPNSTVNQRRRSVFIWR